MTTSTAGNGEERYILGFPEMDVQHDYCYALFDAIEPVFASGDENGRENLMREIERYVLFHCECEEHLMRMYDTPGFAVHQSDHERMQQKLLGYLDDYESGKLQPAAMRIALTGWLMEHSRYSDREYVDWITTKRKTIGVFR